MVASIQEKIEQDRKRFIEATKKPGESFPLKQNEEFVGVDIATTTPLPQDEEFSSVDIMPTEFTTASAIEELEKKLMLDMRQRQATENAAIEELEKELMLDMRQRQATENAAMNNKEDINEALQYAVPVVASWSRSEVSHIMLQKTKKSVVFSQ